MEDAQREHPICDDQFAEKFMNDKPKKSANAVY